MEFIMVPFLQMLLPLISASPDLAAHPWIAPKSTDLRGPCPGLNTLANHGFLPRDGKSLTVSTVLKAGLDGFNVANDVLLLPAKLGLTAGNETDTFSLADIRLHDNIEHDASISREDFANGDNFHFNATTFQTLVDSNPGKDFYDATSAGQVQKARLQIARASNAHLKNTKKEFAIRSRESSLYLAVMGNVTASQAPKKFVQVFFEEERLPIEEGWKRSPIQITGDNLAPIAATIVNASEWSPDPDVCATATFLLAGNITIVL